MKSANESNLTSIKLSHLNADGQFYCNPDDGTVKFNMGGRVIEYKDPGASGIVPGTLVIDFEIRDDGNGRIIDIDGNFIGRIDYSTGQMEPVE